MSQTVYILSNSQFAAQRLDEAIFSNKIYIADSLTEDILLSMASNCRVENFFIIQANNNIEFPGFDFNFRPQARDRHLMHIWNNDTAVRLLNKKEVLKNAHVFTDEAYASGITKIKNIDENIYNFTEYDIIFISFGEDSADENFNKLKTRFPRAKRIDNVRGILQAHKAAAEISQSSLFYVVDADAEILPEFDFNHHLTMCNAQTVYVWHSINPVNNLQYGYGAVKLFPRELVINYSGSPVDFTTTVAPMLNVIPEVSNITRFNTDAFSAWRSGFRECSKLSSKVIINQQNDETEERLHTWCSVGNGEFGNYVVAGARAGRDFGLKYIDQPTQLALINDFIWLKQQFLAVVA